MKTLTVIDANSLIHRAYHALPDTFSSPGGEPTNALYGLASILLKIWADMEPDYAAACFDRPEPTFRKEEYKEYKAHRPETAKELVAQLIEAHNLFDAFGVSVFDAPGFEADDCVATLAERHKGEDLLVEIVSGDLDTLQLVEDGKVVVEAPKKGISETIRYNEAQTKERFGIMPKQLVDYKALVGDSSDNIPGIAGVGKKTAADLLGKYESLEGAYNHINDLPTRAKNTLTGKKEQALKWRELVTLRRDVPLPEISLQELSADIDITKLEAYFTNVLGSKSLVKRLYQLADKDMPRPEQNTETTQSPQGSLL